MRLTDGNRYRLDARLFAWQPDAYEPAVVGRLLSAIGDDSVVWDIGAHVGLITMMAGRKVGVRGHVYAFEPSPWNARQLRRHVEANDLADRVTLVEVLVGDRCQDEVPFTYRPRECTANSLAYEIEGGQVAPVPMLTVDALVRERGFRVPDVLKIDVEGYEHHVVRGARSVLTRAAPLVICAMHPEPLARLGSSPARVVDEMNELGYDAADLAGSPVASAGFEEIVFRKRQ